MCRRCGNLRSECSDPSRDWFPQEAVCWASATVEFGQRELHEFYKDVKPLPGALHPLDGVAVYATDIDGGDWSPDEARG